MTISHTTMPRKRPRLSERDERIQRRVGMVGGIITGALMSVLVICVINHGMPFHNAVLGIGAAAIPGGALGAWLGWLHPPMFVFLMEIILGIFS